MVCAERGWAGAAPLTQLAKPSPVLTAGKPGLEGNPIFPSVGLALMPGLWLTALLGVGDVTCHDMPVSLRVINGLLWMDPAPGAAHPRPPPDKGAGKTHPKNPSRRQGDERG